MTVLWTICYLDGPDKFGGTRFDRMVKWVNYYRDEKIRSALGVDVLAVNDVGSDPNAYLRFTSMFPWLLSEWNDLQQREAPTPFYYPWGWKLWKYRLNLFNAIGAKKVIIVDSDNFILTKRLAEHIRTSEHDWESFYSRDAHMPESGLQVLNERGLEMAHEFFKDGWRKFHGSQLETTLPFTHVEDSFNIGRWGERRLPITDEMDCYCACPLDMGPQRGLL